MILELPITSDSAQQFLTQLGNRKFSFEFKFNEVGSVWTMDIMDPLTNLPLLMGLPLLLGTELLNPYNFQMGNMALIDTTIQGLDAGPDDMGTRLKLYWYTDDEVI